MTETPAIHPDMQVLIDARSPKKPDASVEKQRQQWNAYAAKLARPHPDDLDVVDMDIPASDRNVPVRVYRSRAAKALQPGIIYLHGGGFRLGDLDSSDSIAWGYAAETGAVVVSVDYRLTPEHVWPAAFDDCFAVLQWIAAKGKEIGIDAERVALAGDSAGGRLTAGLCLRARDEGGPRIAAQAIVYGSAGAVADSRSSIQFAEGYGLTTESYRGFYVSLFPDHSYDNDPYAWPIRAQDVSGLPPALVHTAELDPIRDDGRAYAAKLALAGTPVTYREAHGMIHGFMRARFTGPTARAEFESICAFLRGHLFEVIDRSAAAIGSRREAPHFQATPVSSEARHAR